jgi:LysM repeat protein
MTRRQIVLVLAANALVSLLVAVLVLWAGVQLGWLATANAPTPYVIIPPTPTPRPTPTPMGSVTPTPTVATERYEVQEGDTLLGIALRLDVDLGVLLALNDLDDADRLYVGQQLLVPKGSLPTATPEAAEPSTAGEAGLVTPTGTPGPTATPSASGLVIVEVQNAGNPFAEAVALANRGDRPVALRNWSLARADGRSYVFPSFTLRPGATVLVHTGPGIDDQDDLFWAQQEPMWQAPETVTLSNPAGTEIIRYRVGG